MKTRILATGIPAIRLLVTSAGMVLLLTDGAQALRLAAPETRALNQQQPVRLPAEATPAALAIMAEAAPSPGGAPPTPAVDDKAPRFTPLNTLSNLPQDIGGAKVIDSAGKAVGTVRQVEVGSAGIPIKVDILMLDGIKIVTLNAAEVDYDPAHNVVATQLGVAALRRMAQAPQQ